MPCWSPWKKLGIKNPQANFDKVSKTTMDLENQAKPLTAKPLSGKYMDYFADKSRFSTMVEAAHETT